MARTRHVSFRLSEQEYQRLRELAGDGTLTDALRGLLPADRVHWTIYNWPVDGSLSTTYGSTTYGSATVVRPETRAA